MSSSSLMLKGCDAKFIKSLTMTSIRANEIQNKALEIVSTYEIKDCIKIIVKHGDIHDLYVKLQSLSSGEINVSNKLEFHRQIALIYVKQIIVAKVDAKMNSYKPRIKTSSRRRIDCDMTCSICLENIENDRDAHFTPCNHAFHKSCITPLRRNICPMCRGNI
jgi:hypothetical protein